MRHDLNLQNTGHDLQKQNLVTLNDSKGSYDQLKCSKCESLGRRYGVQTNMYVSGHRQAMIDEGCIDDPGKVRVYNDRTSGKGYLTKSETGEDVYLGKEVKIGHCTGNNPAFDNITPGSVHTIVTPMDGETGNGEAGVWVQGVNQKVKILFSEFKMV